MSRSLVVGSYLQVRWWALGQILKKGKHALNDNVEYLNLVFVFCTVQSNGHLFSVWSSQKNPLVLVVYSGVYSIFLSSSQDVAAENAEGQQSNTIIFNSSKAELFTPNNGFKSLVRKLRSNWKVITYVIASLHGANDTFICILWS